jgi:wyosine [tRNA(Phe)-imidazoG37] synthetase (radical SAM superfamily)
VIRGVTNEPGRGAAHLAPPRGRHVYVVRSRRTGDVSIGVDLTPNGACPLACDYCQVKRESRATPASVDLGLLRDELSTALVELGAVAGDLAFAGSGEPTWPVEFPEALQAAREQVARLSRKIPVRVFTCGATLDREPVARALHDLVTSGDGEVWVKLDAWDEATHRRFWSTHGQAEHERRVAAFGRTTPVVLQTMLVHRAGDATEGTTVEQTASGLASVVGRLVAAGCRIERVALSTLFREPGDPHASLCAFSGQEVTRVAGAIRGAGVAVVLPAMLAVDR